MPRGNDWKKISGLENLTQETERDLADSLGNQLLDIQSLLRQGGCGNANSNPKGNVISSIINTKVPILSQ